MYLLDIHVHGISEFRFNHLITKTCINIRKLELCNMNLKQTSIFLVFFLKWLKYSCDISILFVLFIAMQRWRVANISLNLNYICYLVHVLCIKSSSSTSFHRVQGVTRDSCLNVWKSHFSTLRRRHMGVGHIFFHYI